jgi:ABC-2 type transport system ATP-binding protein
VLQGILEAVPAEGGAVVYASHLIHDVERVADRIAVLDQGELVLEGGLEELKSRVRRARAVFEDDAPAGVDLPDLLDWQTEGRVLTVVAHGADGNLASALRSLGARHVEVEPMPLEDILVACLRHSGSDPVTEESVTEGEVEHV